MSRSARLRSVGIFTTSNLPSSLAACRQRSVSCARASPTQVHDLLVVTCQCRTRVVPEVSQPALCEGDGDVVGVVTPLVRGGAQVLHGDQVVELSVQLEVQEVEEEGEDGEGQIEVESEKGELKERRTCTWMT